jgi:hypothetical protein
MSNLAAIIMWLHPTANPLKDFQVDETPGGDVITHWDAAAMGGAKPTENSLLAQNAAYLAAGGKNALFRAQAKALFKEVLDLARMVDRAIVLTSMDEINLIRSWITSYKAAVAAATSFDNFKTRVAALPNLAQRTAVQAKNSIESKIDVGDVDS